MININPDEHYHLITSFESGKVARKFCDTFNSLFGHGLKVEKTIGEGALAEWQFRVILDKKQFSKSCGVGHIHQFDVFLSHYIVLLSDAATCKANHRRLKRIVKKSR